MWQDDDDRAPTGDELMRWEADAIGEQCPEDEWVLTNYDVWMRNPHYKGVKTEGHPEDHEPDCTGHRCEDGFVPPAIVQDHHEDWPDDLPF